MALQKMLQKILIKIVKYEVVKQGHKNINRVNSNNEMCL